MYPQCSPRGEGWLVGLQRATSQQKLHNQMSAVRLGEEEHNTDRKQPSCSRAVAVLTVLVCLVRMSPGLRSVINLLE